ncbi:unnamed protein product [marine sediment metagenome]|uniref:DUF3168 domain-containing protein n=1 Tax=marine sediment metagenome TaxID=412755 RepID=X1I7Y6_9ZZZZ
MIEETVVEMVLDDDKITGYIDDRFYPEKLPQDAVLPAIVYTKISAPEFHDIDVAYPRFQFSCFSKDLLECKNMAIAVKELFQRYKGICEGCHILQGVYLDEVKLPDDSGIHQIAVDIRVVYKKITD